MNHITDLSDEILMDAMSKAESEVMQRRKLEYESWAQCKPNILKFNPQVP